MTQPINFVPKSATFPIRLDRAIRLQFPDWERQAVQKLITSQQVQVQGRSVWLASWQVQKGDSITILNPPTSNPVDKPEPVIQKFKDSWLIEDTGEILAVNKPAGLLCEPTRWGQGINLRDLAIARFGSLILFHRLDRDTSGVVLLTRPGAINKILDSAFKAHTVQKVYLAIVRAPNRLNASGTIEARLETHPQRRDQMIIVEKGGQRAVTRYQVNKTVGSRALVELFPQTGRTHQLRVHLAHLAAPILGDRLYGDQASAPRLLLHAQSITVPIDDAGTLQTFSAALPEEFQV